MFDYKKKTAFTYNIQSVVHCRKFTMKQNVDVSCSEFRWTYGLYIHAVIVEKCMTFKDIFPGLSRTLSFNFQVFSGPKWFSRTFQEAWEPWETVNKPVLGLSSCGHSPTSAWGFISAELSPTINIFHIIHARSEIRLLNSMHLSLVEEDKDWVIPRHSLHLHTTQRYSEVHMYQFGHRQTGRQTDSIACYICGPLCGPG